MFIRFFRSAYPVQYIVYLLLAGLLWSGNFINPQFHDIQVNQHLNPAYLLLIGLLGENTLLNIVASFVCVVSAGFLFNYILVKNRMVPKNTLVPAVVFLVFMSHSVNLLQFHPALIPAAILIFVLYYLFQIYNQDKAYSQIYNAGFLIALASFIYFPSCYFLFYVWFSFIVFRLYAWREWVIVLFGFLTPYLFLWTYYYWNDSLIQVFNAYNDYFSTIVFFHFYYEISTLNFIISVIIIVFCIWSYLLLIRELNEKIITVRKRYWSVLWMFLISIISYLLSLAFFNTHQVLVIVPTSIIVAHGFTKIKKNIWVELIFGILILLIIINNMFNVIV